VAGRDEIPAEVCGNIVVEVIVAAGKGVEKDVKVGVPGVIELRIEPAGNAVEELMVEPCNAVEVEPGNTVGVEPMVEAGNAVEVEPMVEAGNAVEVELMVDVGYAVEAVLTEEPMAGCALMVAEVGVSGTELRVELGNEEEVELTEEYEAVGVGLEKSNSRPVVVEAKVHSLAALSESYALSSAL
jgi:hypothetical protein